MTNETNLNNKTTETTTYPEWLTRKQVAEYLQISTHMVDKLRERGILKRHMIADGSVVRFKKSEIDYRLNNFTLHKGSN